MPVLFGSIYYLPAIIVVVLLLLVLLLLVLRKRQSDSKGAAVPIDATEAHSEPGTASESPIEGASLAESEPLAWSAPPAWSAPSAEPVEPSWVKKISPALTKNELFAPIPEPAEPPAAEAESFEPVETEAAGSAKQSRWRRRDNRDKTPQEFVQPYTPETSAQPQAVPHPQSSISTVPVGVIPLETGQLGDPIGRVIANMVHGWGNLEETDLNRLKLFRLEKVQAAVLAYELPKELKNDQQARSRLTQMQQFVNQLVSTPRPAAKATDTPPAAVPAAEEPSSTHAAQPTDDAFASARPAEEPKLSSGFASFYAAPTPEPVQPAPAAQPAPFAEPEPEPMPDVEPPVLSLYSSRVTSGDPLAAEPAPVNRNIKTAKDLLELSEEQQAQMVMFLEPAELSKVFDQTENADVKRSIIDTLEHVSNPASLEVLRRCLDDPDQEIQVYALRAADRMLGVN